MTTKDQPITFTPSYFTMRVVNALVQAVRQDNTSTINDVPAGVERSLYMQLGEAMVSIAIDPKLREAAEYYAADMLQQEREAQRLSEMSYRQRTWRVLEVQIIIRRFLAFVRGEWPQGIAQYRQMVIDDQTETAALEKARAIREQRERDESPITLAEELQHNLTTLNRVQFRGPR